MKLPTLVVAVVAVATLDPLGAHAASLLRCDDASTADLDVDGLLEDWPKDVQAQLGPRGDGGTEVRCAWDGKAFAIILDIKDNRVVRVPGKASKGHEDHVKLSLSAGGKPVQVVAFPGNAIGKSRLTKPAKVALADSLQPKGYSVELRVPASALTGFSQSTPALQLAISVVDSDQATGGGTLVHEERYEVELGDRKNLLEDFLRAVKLKRADIRFDAMAELDADRRGKERIVAGGSVIGVLTDQFAFVSLPVARAADVKKIELLALGPRGQHVVTALTRQSGNGGSRDVLMLWIVWSGQLHPIGQIEVRKELGGNILESSSKLVKGKKLMELVVEPRPAVGFTAETWNEVPAGDADPILVPWDPTKSGVAYSLTGRELARRELPPKKPAKLAKKR